MHIESFFVVSQEDVKIESYKNTDDFHVFILVRCVENVQKQQKSSYELNKF